MIFDRCRVLVVEDDYLIASDTASVLHAAGASVLGPVPTITQALDFLAATQVDAAVVDIRLRDGVAVELIDQLRHAAVPYVVLSGCDEELFPDLGAGVFLLKPARGADVLAMLAAQISAVRQNQL